MLRAFWGDFDPTVENIKNLPPKEATKRLEMELEPLLFPPRSDGEDPHVCPKCKTGTLELRTSFKTGIFLGCDSYPECDFTRSVGESATGQQDWFGDRPLGADPDGITVLVRKGPFGFYFQRGEVEPGGGKNVKKPPRSSLPEGMDPATATLDDALRYLSLPRTIGTHPETDEAITASIGRFGPYVHHQKTYANIPKGENIFEVGINRAVDLLAAKKTGNRRGRRHHQGTRRASRGRRCQRAQRAVRTVCEMEDPERHNPRRAKARRHHAGRRRAASGTAPGPGRQGQKNHPGQENQKVSGANRPPAARLLGVVSNHSIISTAWGKPRKLHLRPENAGSARDGELVEYAENRTAGGRRGVRVKKRLDHVASASDLRHIAAATYDLSFEHPEDVLAEAEQAREDTPAPANSDTDYLTIDPADARDHDDAIAATPDPDPENPGGHLIRVAIADVAHFVRPGTALAKQARARGNSCYFPDCAAHMLPPRLATDLCSLRAGTPRRALVADIRITATGDILSTEFRRVAILVQRNLTYQQCERLAKSTDEDSITGRVHALMAAYRSLQAGSRKREPLDISMLEKKIELGSDGEVTAIRWPSRLATHRLVEEYMLLANQAAASVLAKKSAAFLHRVHPAPERAQIIEFARALAHVGIVSMKQVNHAATPPPSFFNLVLREARTLGLEDCVALLILRAQQKANYTASQGSHYGLRLDRYAHFTSPIRRYADLVVHRALIRTLELGGEGGEVESEPALVRLAASLNERERAAAMAERDTVARCAAAFLEGHQGTLFEGMVTGLTGSGIFVRIGEIGSDGFVARRRDDFPWKPNYKDGFFYRQGVALAPGLRLRVRLHSASRLNGNVELKIFGVIT